MAATARKLTSREKAAVLMIAVGKNHAAQVYKHLSEEEIATLTLAITTTSKVTQEEKNAVLNEFYETALAQKFISEGGLDYARSVLNKALGEAKANEILGKLTETLQVRPFEYVRKADPSQVVHLVANENPQTVALLLSYLEPAKAASVLSALPGDMQVDVVTRMASMESVIPEYIREVEMIFEQRLAKMGMSDQTSVGGIEAVVNIINNVDRGTEKFILETLDMLDAELSESIKRSMFVFEDITKLSNQAIQTVLKQVEQSDIAIALKGATDEVKNFIMSNLSKRLQEMIKDDLDVMGPMKMRDVEDAQQKIVNAVRTLEESGEIIVSRGDGSDVLL
ncbi:Flagellar motor switch protein FliG [bioreactor metagenome]|uniref:Flagellar motor switch protein FliG n=1 Tax=bioreactor metagenome TaxID=1076179 RepID=A0A644ZE26_9ZZZZ